MEFPTPTLLPWQLVVVGVTASVATTAVGWLIDKAVPLAFKLLKKKVEPPVIGRFVKTGIFTLVGAGLALWWYPATIPAYPSMAGLTFQAQWALFWPWLGAAGAAVAPTVGAGTFIYNMALGYLTDPGRRAEAFRKLLEWLLTQKLSVGK